MLRHDPSSRNTLPGAIVVVGGGLAGSEAAWQAAERGARVTLFEMRPVQMTPAHRTAHLAELVCSNSLGSSLPNRALGLLKNELRRLGSLVIACADATSLPAGDALAVGREAFGQAVTCAIQAHPRIELHREAVSRVPDEGLTVLATGPLTSHALASDIERLAGRGNLSFYDAMAPIITADSIDLSIAFKGSRQPRHRGEPEFRGDDARADYINCPLSRDQYFAFVEALLAAQRTELHNCGVEGEEHYFEACLPIEVLAARSPEALAFGPMRPIGLRDPHTGRRPFAVVQLRQDDLAGTLYNLVGFQTNIRWTEQERVLRMIPGLQRAEFVRLGQMHRNTFLNSPLLLRPTLQWATREELLVAGQLIGTEGYVGSTASGLLAGLNAARLVQGLQPVVFPRTTMIGALVHYITHTKSDRFQPMKANFGLLPDLEAPVPEKQRRHDAFAARALGDLDAAIDANNI